VRDVRISIRVKGSNVSFPKSGRLVLATLEWERDVIFEPELVISSESSYDAISSAAVEDIVCP